MALFHLCAEVVRHGLGSGRRSARRVKTPAPRSWILPGLSESETAQKCSEMYTSGSLLFVLGCIGPALAATSTSTQVQSTVTSKLEKVPCEVGSQHQKASLLLPIHLFEKEFQCLLLVTS